MRLLPQFAYLPGRGLSDAQSRVVQHLREVRELCRTANPSRMELQRGHGPADLVGGITFALDLPQAFDTVSRSEILSLLDELGAEPSLQHLIHALHHRSKYRLYSLGDHQDVETTTGIKQRCKLAPTLFSVLTGRLLHTLISIFGWGTVQKFFTGYADDFTMHRTIRSQADLAAAHKLILHLLDAVEALKLKVNQAKCAMLVKLNGREAPRVLQRHTCWLPDTDGVLQRHWRLGRHRSWPAYRWEAQMKYLGIQMSCGNFEKQTLRFRMAEAAKKLQQVRRFVYNRRHAGPRARLRVWFTTVWATLVTGLPEVGLTEETARLLRGWYAHKLRSVLNQPVHVSRIPTADLFRLHSIQDPVDKLRERMRSRLRRLTLRGTAHTPTELSTIIDTRSHGLTLLNTPGSQATESQQAAPTGESVDITTLPYLLQDVQDILTEAQNISAPTQQPSHGCTHCHARFVSEYGLHMHVTRMHRDKVDRYIPGDFDRSLHAKDGMPICAACGKEFKQWKGLRDHLLSGACSRPDQLRSLSTTPEAQVQSTA